MLLKALFIWAKLGQKWQKRLFSNQSLTFNPVESYRYDPDKFNYFKDCIFFFSFFSLTVTDFREIINTNYWRFY